MAGNTITPSDNNLDQEWQEANKLLQQGDPQSQLKAQMMLDQVNEQVTMESNLEKAHHELMMAVTNNIGH